MTPQSAGPGRGVFSRLGVRLVATFGLALLPLAILSFVQIRQYESEANARAEAAMLGATVRVAAPQIDRIMRARGEVAALASAVLVLENDVPACRAVLRDIVERSDTDVSFAAFIRPDGIAACSSVDEPMDFSASPQLRALMSDPQGTVTVNRHGPASGESVLVFAHPVRDAAGAVAGLVSLSVPHRSLDVKRYTSGDAVAEPDVLLTFDGEGEILTSSVGLDAAALELPEGRSLRSLVGLPGQSFTALSVAGRSHVFAVVPMVEGSLYVLAAWPAVRPGGPLIDPSLPGFVFPMLMWAASVLVALVAAEHQVLRHIRALRDTITSFADGSRSLARPDVRSAPGELVDVSEAFARMTESVIHDEAELEDMIHQKEVLLREVHHRVKNNLQLIASIINMQIRKAQSSESKSLMKGLQDRVMSLATIHRELYQTTGLTDIRADELMQSIVRQIVRMGAQPGRPFDVSTRFDDIRLTPDQAVPLSLLVTEALANALKYSVAEPGELPRLVVSLTRAPDGQAELVVANTAAGAPAPPVVGGIGTGLGDQLIRAFALQLGGVMDRGHHDGSYVLAVRFPLTPLSDGEERTRLA